MVRQYDKLVRDDVPDVIRADGERPVTHRADDEEYERRLREKLVEEATEFHEDQDLDELADVLAVVRAICDYRDVSMADIQALEAEKEADRGGFAERIVLEEVRE